MASLPDGWLTPLQETTLRRLQADFVIEAAKRQEAAALIVTWRHADDPMIHLSGLAQAGGLPILGESDGVPVAGKWFDSRRVEQDGELRSRLVVYGNKAAMEKYERLSKAACQALQLQSDPCEWARLLFVLAWRAGQHPGTTLHADKWTVRGGVRITKPDQALSKRTPVTELMKSALAGAEPLTASALPDLFVASVAAIDLFLCGAEDVPFAQVNAGKRRHKRGRKRLQEDEVKRRNDILSAWERARNAGTAMKTFCREHDTPLFVKELERIIAWKAARERRKREK